MQIVWFVCQSKMKQRCGVSHIGGLSLKKNTIKINKKFINWGNLISLQRDSISVPSGGEQFGAISDARER